MPDDRKVALVIGNGAYAHASKLDAPKRDAIEMASLLERIGFSVVAGFDCDYYRFRDLAEDFYDRLDPQAVGLFYYSGHGAQGQDGGNHMLPVDARLVDPRDLGRVTLPLNGVLAAMRGKARVSLILLDACRDDPFAELSRTTGTKSAFAGRPGLAAVPRASLGQALIGFAAEEGHTALDSGGGQPSPFTAALVRHLGTPGKDIRDILGDVRRDVFAATDGRQTPWTKEALTDEVVLVPDAAAPPMSTTTDAPAAPVIRDETPSAPAPAVPRSGEEGRSQRWLPAVAAVGAAALIAVGLLAWRPAVLCTLPSTGDFAACVPDLSAAAELARMIPDLNEADASGMALKTLAGTFSVDLLAPTEKAELARALLGHARPERLATWTPAGQGNLLAVLAAIGADDWTNPLWSDVQTVAIEVSGDLIAAVRDRRLTLDRTAQSHLGTLEETLIASGSGSTELIRGSSTLLGGAPDAVDPASVQVFPHFAGYSHDAIGEIFRSFDDATDWDLQPLDEQRSAAGLAQVRYGPDRMKASAEVLARQLSDVVGRQVLARQLSIIEDNTLEIWIGK